MIEHLVRPIEGAKITMAKTLPKQHKAVLTLESGRVVTIYDADQIVDEKKQSRYMHTDDAMKALVGKTLVAVDEGAVEYEDENHQTVSVTIKTEEEESVTLTFHNEHDGNYPGFRIYVLDQNPRDAKKAKLVPVEKS